MSLSVRVAATSHKVLLEVHLILGVCAIIGVRAIFSPFAFHRCLLSYASNDIPYSESAPYSASEPSIVGVRAVSRPESTSNSRSETSRRFKVNKGGRRSRSPTVPTARWTVSAYSYRGRCDPLQWPQGHESVEILYNDAQYALRRTLSAERASATPHS